MINIVENDIHYYISRLQRGIYFAFAGYSDAEWFCILRRSLGVKTGLGQILHGPTGDRLQDVIRRRQGDSNFLVAIPKCMWIWKGFTNNNIDKDIEGVLKSYAMATTFYERDMVTDDLAKNAGLYPLIQQLQKMRTIVIGPRHLRKGLDFLGYDHFVEISSPNLHLQDQGIENAVEDALSYNKGASNSPVVYLVSAGISAALIIDQLYDKTFHRFLIDCGSIWDAFSGAGNQRGWRKKLYENPEAWERWKRANITGKP